MPTNDRMVSARSVNFPACTALRYPNQIASAIHSTAAPMLWMALAIWFGYLSAVHAGKFTDRALTILSLVGISMPVFWLAAILLYYLSFKAELFPASSYVPLTKDPLDWAYHLILPWLTLAVLYVGFY